ncbi:MAG: diguanylate cyclase [Phycisphaerales bacterium]|nr:diguanylate cyclase [Phycisphaerales bacterium]
MSIHQDLERDGAALIMIVSEAEDLTESVTDLLQTTGYRTVSTADATTAVSISEKYRPNAILLDAGISNMNAAKLCKELKTRFATEDNPVLFLTAPDPTEETITGYYEAGGHDVIPKPISKAILLARLQVVLREQSLREAYRKLATQDPHTGLDNRRQFFLQLSDAITAAKRDHTEIVLALGDLDKLTRINAKYGHDFGDEVILTFARLLKRFVSPDCIVGRITDDAIAVALRNTTEAKALTFCERIGQTFAAVAFDADSDPKHFTASFGLARLDGASSNDDGDDLMNQADIALFEAKRVGHGRICAYWKLDPDALSAIDQDKRHARHSSRETTNRAYVGVEETSEPTDSTPSQQP